MPRSPSRDLSDRYDGNRGYFRRPCGTARLKHWLAFAGLGAAVGWAAFDLLLPGRAAHTHTHGPLAGPHALWEANCDACHVRFSAADVGPLSLFRAGARWHALSCEKCHAGPPHHANVNAEGAAFHAQCGNCHEEHRGRLHPLARVADGRCTRCHANLADHRRSAEHPFCPSVTGFAKDHPEFRALAEYPGNTPYDRRTLKFSHGLHMTPGMTHKKDAKITWTLGRLAELSGPDAAARYRRPGQTDAAPVALDCSCCHQMDAGYAGVDLAFPEGGGPARPAKQPRPEGAYYAPVNFEAHCKACHPLRAPAGVSGTAVLSVFEVPHRKQPNELKELIAGEYSRRLLDVKNPAAAAVLGPGGRFDPRGAPALATFQGEVDRLTRTALAALLQGGGRSDGPGALHLPSGGYACGKCHELAAEGAAAPPRIVPLSTGPVWFPHARFSHAAHRGVSCGSCHPGTGAAYFGEGWTTEKEPIRIAGVEACRQCHGPQRTAADANGTRLTLGGVRYACTDCHRYHNGDHPLQGRGADARKAGEPLTPGEFFRGGR
jgi:hypothetical protein